MTETTLPPADRSPLRWPTLLAALLLGLLAVQDVAAAALADELGQPGEAEDLAGPYAPLRRDPLGTRLIDLPTAYTGGERVLEVLFLHRFQEPVNNGSAHDLWGLDSGADVGIGLGYGVTRHLDLSLLRSSFQEDYELAGKFMILEQARRVPLSLAVRAGADLLERPGVVDPNRPFAQLVISRRLLPGIDLMVAPSWVRDTPRLRDAWNVPLGLTFPLPGGSLLELEYVPRNRDLKDSLGAWHAAISKAVGQHLFSLVLGNSRATTVDQYLGGDSAAGFREHDVRLGFNLVRTFHL
ncbi:MAG TPA: DUF5777 family beta-barrel protein [Thermoanaerobaculia bacterium]